MNLEVNIIAKLCKTMDHSFKNTVRFETREYIEPALCRFKVL